MTSFAHLYDEFTDTADRLECVQSGPADASLEAWRNGEPRPERSVRTSPWLARIALNVTDPVRPKRWRRVRLVEWPLTDYTRWELVAFVESQACGEEIRLLDRDRLGHDGPDLWCFDLDTDHGAVGELHYGDHGEVEHRELVTTPAGLTYARQVWTAAWEIATPLNEWLAAAEGARV